MNDPVSLYWLPEALCGRVAQDLSALLRGFCERWGLPAHGSVEVSPERAAASAGNAEAGQGESAADLHAPLPHAWRDAVARALFNHPATASPILRGVLDRAEQDLQASLAGKFGPRVPSNRQAATPGDAGVVAHLEWLGLAFELRLSCAQLLAGGWLKRPASAGALTRVNLESALAPARVPLTAQLGSVEVNVGDLLHLAAGDVLLLAESLDEPLRIDSPGSALHLRALLGAAPLNDPGPPHRAIRWLAH